MTACADAYTYTEALDAAVGDAKTWLASVLDRPVAPRRAAVAATA